MGWVLTLDDFVLRDGELTIADAERLEDETSTNWRYIDPLRSAKHAAACLRVGYEKAGLSKDEAAAKTAALSIDAFTDMYSLEDKDDLPTEYTDGFPQPAAGTSTDS